MNEVLDNTVSNRVFAVEELDRLRAMVVRWKESYIRMAVDEADSEVLAMELFHEIEEFMYPFVHRMYVCRHLTDTQVTDFMNFCHAQIMELKAGSRKEA